jgi:serine/threonine-protein kinase HipA
VTQVAPSLISAARIAAQHASIPVFRVHGERVNAPATVTVGAPMVAFNVLACNTDAHAKNYSIMIRGNGASLAPMYDVMCGEVWESVTKSFAQKIAGEGRGDNLKGIHWQSFARECGLNPKQVVDRVGTLAKLALAEAGAAESEVAAMPAGTHEILEQARESVEKRADAILTRLYEVERRPVAEAVAT